MVRAKNEFLKGRINAGWQSRGDGRVRERDMGNFHWIDKLVGTGLPLQVVMPSLGIVNVI